MLLPVSVDLILLFDFITVPLSLPLHFYFAVWRTRCPCPYLPIWVVLHCSYGWKPFLPYAYYLYTCLSFVYFAFVCLLFVFCFLVFPLESLPGDDVLCRLLSRPLPSVCFLPCLLVLLCFSPTVLVPGLFWYNFLYRVATAGFVADQLIR